MFESTLREPLVYLIKIALRHAQNLFFNSIDPMQTCQLRTKPFSPFELGSYSRADSRNAASPHLQTRA